jgi:hypothetical protein
MPSTAKRVFQVDLVIPFSLTCCEIVDDGLYSPFQDLLSYLYCACFCGEMPRLLPRQRAVLARCTMLVHYMALCTQAVPCIIIFLDFQAGGKAKGMYVYIYVYTYTHTYARENIKTDAERAEELYWAMYNRRVSVAAGAFAEASMEVAGGSAQAHANGSNHNKDGQHDEEADDARVVDPTQEIAEKLKELTESLSVHNEGLAGEDGAGRADGAGDVEFVKSKELEALEAELAKQREERRVFEERLQVVIMRVYACVCVCM